MKLGKVRKATPEDGPVFGGGSGIVILGGFKPPKEASSNKDPVVEQDTKQAEEGLHQPEQEEE